MAVADLHGDVTSVSLYTFNATPFDEDHNRTTSVGGIGEFKSIVMVSMVSNLLLSAVIVGANGLTLLAECRTKSLKNIRNKYIVSLAVADFYVGFTYGAMVFQNYGRTLQSVDECRYYLGTLYSTLTVSLFSMLLVAVDRYVYIAHPFFYMRKVTERKINVLIVVKWATSYSYGFSTTYATGAQACNPSYIFDNRMIGYSFPSFFLLVSVGIGITYGRTAMIAKKYVDRRNKRMVLMNKVVCKNRHSPQLCRKGDGERPPSTGQVLETSLEDLVRQEVSIKSHDAMIRNDDYCMHGAFATPVVDEIRLQHEQQQNKSGCPNIQKIPEVDIILCVEKGVTNDDIFTEMFDDFDGTTVEHSIEVRQEKIALATEHSTPSEMCDRSIDKISSPVSGHIRTQMIAADGCSEYLERRCEQPESCTEKSQKGVLETGFCVQLRETQDLETQCKLGTFCEQNSEPVDPQTGSRHQQGKLRDTCEKSNDQQGSRVLKSAPPDQTPVAEAVPNPCSLASLRWMKQMVVVFGLFVVCWTPSMVYILMSLVHTPEIRLMYILSVFGVANSGVNFFVYSFLDKGFRTAIKRRIRCHCKD